MGLCEGPRVGGTWALFSGAHSRVGETDRGSQGCPTNQRVEEILPKVPRIAHDEYRVGESPSGLDRGLWKGGTWTCRPEIIDGTN